MNSLRRFEAAVTLLADAGLDPLAAASMTELRDAIVAKSSKFTADTDRAELVQLVHLVEELETLLDRLSAEQAVA